MLELITTIIKEVLIEQALIIIPVLWFIGKVVKGTKKISDEWIPVILTLLGILLANAILGVSVGSSMQGVIAAGIAIYGNQLLKQGKKWLYNKK